MDQTSQSITVANMRASGSLSSLSKREDGLQPPSHIQPSAQSTVRCSGTTKDGEKCKTPVKTSDPSQLSYCSHHYHTSPGVTTRYCEGYTRKNRKCFRRVDAQPGQARFCNQHQKQHALVDYVRCSGKDAEGIRCNGLVRRQPPYGQFCIDHVEQLADFGCPIASLPVEVLSIVLRKLEPTERISFALANKSCADVVKSWSPNENLSVSIPTSVAARPSLNFINHGCTVVIYVEPELDMRRHFLCSFFWTSKGAMLHHVMVHRDALPESTASNNTKIIHLDEACSCASEQLFRRGKDLKTFVEIFHSRLTDLMLTDSHLFAQKLGSCMRCKTKLNSEDSKKWTRRHNPLRQNQSLLHNVRRRYEGTVASNNPATLLCSECIDNTESMFVEWCELCRGPFPDLELMRTYWNTQPNPCDEVLEPQE